EDRDRVAEKIAAALDPEGDGEFSDEHRIVRSDGEVRWLLMQGRTVFRGKGDARKAVRNAGVVLDITERHLFEETLDHARERAEQASEAKSIFLANMSHEIRTPLTAILGYADVLSARLDDPDAKQCLGTIRENGNYLCDILNDILDLSKIEAGKLVVRREPCKLVEILADIRSLMLVRATEKSLALSVRVQGIIPEVIQTDPKMFRQILVNLVGNAIKFTEHGTVQIEACYLPEKNKVGIAVSDTGIGIPQDAVERLFQPFEQIDVSSTRSIGGSGLGLAISRNLVSMLGGELTVESEVGKGSTFRFGIETGPLNDVDWVEPGEEVFRGEKDKEPQKLPKLFGNLLAIDDRPEIRFLIREFVESAGGMLETAQNGKEGVERWSAARENNLEFDGILLDIQMPIMDGYETARTLRSEGYKGPIIALSANAMAGDREKALHAGCDDFVTKPINRTELVGKLAEWLGGAKSPQAESVTTGVAVLLVDDSKATRMSQRMLLEQQGHRVQTAASGDEALQTLDEFYPDACVIDLGLDGMSGGQLLSQLKSIPSLNNCTFICLSGRDEEDVDWRAMGFHHYLQKPASLESLNRMLMDGERR
ncbi:MAG: response regulator, partial [Planctomycetaceae bacterium]|nr:response regulator [Planctomycetaceae bacterium]